MLQVTLKLIGVLGAKRKAASRCAGVWWRPQRMIPGAIQGCGTVRCLKVLGLVRSNSAGDPFQARLPDDLLYSAVT